MSFKITKLLLRYINGKWEHIGEFEYLDPRFYHFEAVKYYTWYNGWIGVARYYEYYPKV